MLFLCALLALMICGSSICVTAGDAYLPSVGDSETLDATSDFAQELLYTNKSRIAYPLGVEALAFHYVSSDIEWLKAVVEDKEVGPQYLNVQQGRDFKDAFIKARGNLLKKYMFPEERKFFAQDFCSQGSTKLGCGTADAKAHI